MNWARLEEAADCPAYCGAPSGLGIERLIASAFIRRGEAERLAALEAGDDAYARVLRRHGFAAAAREDAQRWGELALAYIDGMMDLPEEWQDWGRPGRSNKFRSSASVALAIRGQLDAPD